MNTQAHVQRLAAGQSLLAGGNAVLSEGELLLQEPAQWLAGTVVVPAPVRLLAPAVVPVAPGRSIVAVRASTVVVTETVPVLAAFVRSATAAWRRLARRWTLGTRTRVHGRFAN